MVGVTHSGPAEHGAQQHTVVPPTVGVHVSDTGCSARPAHGADTAVPRCMLAVGTCGAVMEHLGSIVAEGGHPPRSRDGPQCGALIHTKPFY